MSEPLRDPGTMTTGEDEIGARKLLAFVAVPLGVPYEAAVQDLSDAHLSRDVEQSAHRGFIGTSPVDALIWWTNQSDCAVIETIGFQTWKLAHTESDGLAWWPDYLRAQYQSRYGRGGRGRLWVDERFGEIDISGRMNTIIGKCLAEASGTYAGIVIATEDVGHVAGLPGLITDFDLLPVSWAIRRRPGSHPR